MIKTGLVSLKWISLAPACFLIVFAAGGSLFWWEFLQIELLPSWSVTEAYLIWIRPRASVIGFQESYCTSRTYLPPRMRIFVVAMADTCTAAESAASSHVPSNLVGAPVFCMQPPEFVPVDSWVFMIASRSRVSRIYCHPLHLPLKTNQLHSALLIFNKLRATH